MEQKTLAGWLKFIIIGVAVCGIIVCWQVLPFIGRVIMRISPAYEAAYYPWLGFLWGVSIPCFAMLILAWLVATNIGRDRTFSMSNAMLFRRIAYMAAIDTFFFLFGNVLFLLVGLSHPSILMASLLVDFVGIAITVAAAALSHLVSQAADLQEQSDLTV